MECGNQEEIELSVLWVGCKSFFGERKRVDLHGNVVYYIHWFDKYGYNITNEWKFWSKGPKKKYDRVNRYLTDSWLKEYCGNNDLKIRRIKE